MRLKEHMIASTAIYGNAICLKQRSFPGAEPDELWPLDWRRLRPFTEGPDGPISHYEYDSGLGKRALLRPIDVVHLQWWGPEGLGVSPLEPLRQTLASEAAAGKYQTASFVNGIRPSGALVTAKNLRPDQRQEIRAEFEAAHSGIDRTGGMLLLDGGMQWQSLGGSAADAQMLETRALNRDEVCAVYDIPPPMVGILDRATFSNIDEQHRMLYQDTLGPWITNYEQTFQTQLVDVESAWRDSFLEYDLDEVLRGDIEKRSQAYQRFLMAGVLSPNEMRRMENKPMIENPLADAVYVPLAMTAIGEELPGVATSPEQQAAALLGLVGLRSNGNGD